MSQLVPVEAVRNTNNAIFTGIQYGFKGRASHKWLDGRSGGGMDVVVRDGNPAELDVLRWFIYPGDDQFYAVRSERSRCYLDGRSKESDNNVVVTNVDPSGNPALQWSFERVQGFYAMKGRLSEKYLDGRNTESDNNVVVTNRSPVDDYVLQWSFMPSSYKLSAKIVNFTYDSGYDDLSKFVKESPTAVVWNMANESHDLPITVNPAIRQKRENYNSWTFTQSKERSFVGSIESEISAEFMGIGSKIKAKAEWSTKTTNIESTEKRQVDTTEVEMTSNITIPPRTKASYVITWSDVDVFIDYTAVVCVTGLADRTTRDGDTKPLQKIPPEATLSLINYAGFDGKVIAVEDDVVKFVLKGVMHANGAISGNLVMKSSGIDG